MVRGLVAGVEGPGLDTAYAREFPKPIPGHPVVNWHPTLFGAIEAEGGAGGEVTPHLLLTIVSN